MGKRGPKPKRKEVIWSPELAYAIGLIATDGSLSTSGRHVNLTSKDRPQLKTFLKCIGRSDVRIAKKKGSYRPFITYVQIGDVVLYRFLRSIGLTTNKTKSIGVLAIPDKYMFDFLRGHHDGDGSFYSYFDPRWRNSFMFYLQFISASPAHVYWIRETLERLLRVRGHITTSQNTSVVQLKYAKRETLLILKKLYPYPDVVCLKRKRLKIERALRIVGKSLPQPRRKAVK
ncbi:MAG: LAGLIDADG family homing endonuclease [Minisyncoccota bacterium]